MLCTIEADLSRVPILPQPKVTGTGNFYEIEFDIILLFGMTELVAQVAWKEKVSGFYMLFILIDITLILRVAFGEKKNGTILFFKKFFFSS